MPTLRTLAVCGLVVALIGILAYAAQAQTIGISDGTGGITLGPIPNPSASTLGGVKAATCSNSFLVVAIDTSGNPICNPLGSSQGQWRSTGPTTVAATSDTSVYGGTGNGVGTQTIAANKAYVGETFIFEYSGVYSLPALNAATLASKVKWGGTTLTTVTTAGLGIALTSTNFPFNVRSVCTIQVIGSSGKVACSSVLSTTPQTVSTGPLVSTAITVTAVTVDTTASGFIDSTMAWSSVAAGQTASVVLAGIQRTS